MECSKPTKGMAVLLVIISCMPSVINNDASQWV